MSDPSVLIGAAASLVIVVGGVAGWLKEGRPKWRARQERERQRDYAILGGEKKDPLTGQVIGVQPPLGEWMSNINGSLAKLTNTVASLNDAHRRLDVVETNQALLQRDVAELKKARDDR